MLCRCRVISDQQSEKAVDGSAAAEVSAAFAWFGSLMTCCFQDCTFLPAAFAASNRTLLLHRCIDALLIDDRGEVITDNHDRLCERRDPLVSHTRRTGLK